MARTEAQAVADFATVVDILNGDPYIYNATGEVYFKNALHMFMFCEDIPYADTTKYPGAQTIRELKELHVDFSNKQILDFMVDQWIYLDSLDHISWKNRSVIQMTQYTYATWLPICRS